MEVITILNMTAPRSRGHGRRQTFMTFVGNKPYDVAHHFDSKFDGESNGDLENHRKVTKTQKIHKNKTKFKKF